MAIANRWNLGTATFGILFGVSATVFAGTYYWHNAAKSQVCWVMSVCGTRLQKRPLIGYELLDYFEGCSNGDACYYSTFSHFSVLFLDSFISSSVSQCEVWLCWHSQSCHHYLAVISFSPEWCRSWLMTRKWKPVVPSNRNEALHVSGGGNCSPMVWCVSAT